MVHLHSQATSSLVVTCFAQLRTWSNTRCQSRDDGQPGVNFYHSVAYVQPHDGTCWGRAIQVSALLCRGPAQIKHTLADNVTADTLYQRAVMTRMT